MEWFGLFAYVLLTVAMVRLYGQRVRRRRLLPGQLMPGYIFIDRALTPREVDNLKQQWLTTRHKPGVWLR